MFSIASITNFLSINTVVTAVSFCKYALCDMFTTENPAALMMLSIAPFVVSEIVTNLFLIKFTNSPKKKYIESNSYERLYEPQEEYKGEFIYYMLMSSLIKGISHYYISPISFNNQLTFTSAAIDIGTFIIKSFVLEVVFDGCHYTIHRFAHSNAILYKHVHKIHHKHIHPSIYTTFYMHPVDILLSYTLPLYVSMKVIGCSRFQFYMYITYLSLQEIAGHSGKAMYPSSGFAQCIWLPKLFHFELYTDDHDLHHTKFNYNYSKRFTLWDKLFGTYMKPETLKN
jgi:sterol desaturase/sphingolipid hydroxylase (fatty acid hydroxylase superfamily)